jgi:hypothetical protein
MIDVDTFYKIKHLNHDGHFRVGQIAEQLHLDVETVSKWIQREPGDPGWRRYGAELTQPSYQQRIAKCHYFKSMSKM